MGETAAWAHDETLHAWWVEPGRLLAGEYPGARTPKEASEKLRLLIETAMIDSIVDLTTPADGLAPYREALRVAAEKAGRQVDHYAYPIPDMGVNGQEGYDAIVARIRGEMADGRVVYLHCWGGKGRTSTVVGCLLIDDGLDYDRRSRASPSCAPERARHSTRARNHLHSIDYSGSGRAPESRRTTRRGGSRPINADIAGRSFLHGLQFGDLAASATRTSYRHFT